MHRIGLTGGIASGKSLAAELLAQQGAKILDADLIARELVAPGHPNVHQIGQYLGPQYLCGQTLNRELLRQRIFADPPAKAWLEQLLHPQIRAELLRQSSLLEGEEPVIWVVPLLVEGNYQKLLDGVLLIDSPVWLQRERLRLRGWDLATAKRVIAQQSHAEERRKIATWIIPNLQSPAELSKRLQHWWKSLR
ncbi:MAG: dephospho-CoA kinase [Acidithiobacillus sp.]|nr:dephospho-CoA kinase [Acidithiobacillus sp.]